MCYKVYINTYYTEPLKDRSLKDRTTRVFLTVYTADQILSSPERLCAARTVTIGVSLLPMSVNALNGSLRPFEEHRSDLLHEARFF